MGAVSGERHSAREDELWRSVEKREALTERSNVWLNRVLRDEGEAYARKLSQPGVPVTAIRYLGTVHGFVLLNGLAKTPPVRSAIELATTHLRSALAIK